MTSGLRLVSFAIEMPAAHILEFTNLIFSRLRFVFEMQYVDVLCLRFVAPQE